MSRKIKNKIRFFLKDVVDNRGRNPEQYFDKEKYPVIDNFLIENKIYPNLKKVKRYIDQKTYDSFLRKYLQKNDVLVTLVGNGFCNVSLSPSNQVVIIQNTIGLQTNEKLHNKFLYYYLILQQKNLVKLNRSSSQPSLNQQDLLDYEIEIPENVQDQDKIASVLFTLDSKIELNNKINTELESIAKTLYDYWFVQFDFPNENGNPYKSSGGEMVWSEELKRDIPKGWEVKKIGDLLEKYTDTSKKIPSKEILEEGNYPVISQDAGSFISGYTNEENPINNIPIIIFGDHSCTLRYVDFPFFRGADGTQIMTFASDLIFYVYQFLESSIMSLPHYGKYERHYKYLKELLLIIPPKDLLLKFNVLIKPSLEKRKNILLENQKLAELRDFLLPMLMNGQVVVE